MVKFKTQIKIIKFFYVICVPVVGAYFFRVIADSHLTDGNEFLSLVFYFVGIYAQFRIAQS